MLDSLAQRGDYWVEGGRKDTKATKGAHWNDDMNIGASASVSVCHSGFLHSPLMWRHETRVKRMEGANQEQKASPHRVFS